MHMPFSSFLQHCTIPYVNPILVARFVTTLILYSRHQPRYQNWVYLRSEVSQKTYVITTSLALDEFGHCSLLTQYLHLLYTASLFLAHQQKVVKKNSIKLILPYVVMTSVLLWCSHYFTDISTFLIINVFCDLQARQDILQ